MIAKWLRPMNGIEQNIFLLNLMSLFAIDLMIYGAVRMR